MNDLRDTVRDAARSPEVRQDLPGVVRRARAIRRRQVVVTVIVSAVVLAALVLPLAGLRNLGDRTLPDEPAGRHVSGFGVSAVAPPDWRATLAWGSGNEGVVLSAAPRSGTIPRSPIDVAVQGNRTAVFVRVVEVTSLCPCSGFDDAWPRFVPSDWYVPTPRGSDRMTRFWQNAGGYLRLVTVADRSFVVLAYVGGRPSPSPALATIDTFLSSIVVGEPGSTPPPASSVDFVDSTGWRVMGSGPTTKHWVTQAVASTTGFGTGELYFYALDGAMPFLPYGTIARLGPTDAVVTVEIRRPSPGSPSGPAQIDLSSATCGRHFEGIPPNAIQCELSGALDQRHLLVIDVYTTGPMSAGVRQRVQHLLDGLQVKI
ncbi:MAG: hypothetical protein ACM3OO_03365 [Planctomycetaceae bacterium]